MSACSETGAQVPVTKEHVLLRPTRTAVTVLLVAGALALAAPAAAGARALLLSGSTSIYPLMIQLAAAYHKATHQPTPKVGQGTSDAGINEVNAGKVDIGDVSRDPIIGVDPHGLVFTKIARDGVCMITNPCNPWRTSTSKRSRRSSPATCATGAKCRARKSRARSTSSTASPPRVRRTHSRTSSWGRRLKISPSADAEESNGLVQSKVKNDPSAIGFVSFAFTAGRQRRRLPGHPLHAAERQVRSVPGRA